MLEILTANVIINPIGHSLNTADIASIVAAIAAIFSAIAAIASAIIYYQTLNAITSQNKQNNENFLQQQKEQRELFQKEQEEARKRWINDAFSKTDAEYWIKYKQSFIELKGQMTLLDHYLYKSLNPVFKEHPVRFFDKLSEIINNINSSVDFLGSLLIEELGEQEYKDRQDFLTKLSMLSNICKTMVMTNTNFVKPCNHPLMVKAEFKFQIEENEKEQFQKIFSEMLPEMPATLKIIEKTIEEIDKKIRSYRKNERK